jgi:hypothetical protein
MKVAPFFFGTLSVAVFLFGSIVGARDGSDALTRPIAHAPTIKQSLEIRARYNIPTPESEVAIYVDSVSVHHLREEQSAVATRDADGHWHVSAVVEEGPGLLNVEPHLVSNDTRTLSDTEGRQLDELLAQDDLYRERWESRETPAVGAMFHTMEIDTPAGHMVIWWFGRLGGKAGTVADLVIGRG